MIDRYEMIENVSVAAVCLQCGSMVNDVDAHNLWHESMGKAASDAQYARMMHTPIG